MQKNIQNIRALWLDRSAVFHDRDYLIFENERYTYAQVAERASKIASLLYTKYAVRKGDRGTLVFGIRIRVFTYSFPGRPRLVSMNS